MRSFFGHTDPRALKETLAGQGFSCWLDVEQLGTSTSGLFGGLHAAFQQSKVVILCMSDEYSQSANCCMEMQYAIRRVPCIVAAVGSGYGWRKDLLGYFAAFQDYVDFVVNPYPASMRGAREVEKLIGMLRRRIEDPEHRECWLQATTFK